VEFKGTIFKTPRKIFMVHASQTKENFGGSHISKKRLYESMSFSVQCLG
jgi:hypothetical protein